MYAVSLSTIATTPATNGLERSDLSCGNSCGELYTKMSSTKSGRLRKNQM